MSDTANQRVATFSRGMRQRLGLADVLIKEPHLPIQLHGAVFEAPLPLDQSLALIWPHLTGLIAATLLLFAVWESPYVRLVVGETAAETASLVALGPSYPPPDEPLQVEAVVRAFGRAGAPASPALR